jgi:hypothetical protein
MLPLNRIVAFFGPYISILAGIVSTWLTTHVHVLATFHIDQDSVSGTLTQAGVFGVSTLVVWLGHQKWLTGHQIELAAQAAAWAKAGETAKGLGTPAHHVGGWIPGPSGSDPSNVPPGTPGAPR